METVDNSVAHEAVGEVDSRLATVENCDVGIARTVQDFCGARHQPVVVVAQHDAGRAARHQIGEAQFETAQRDVARPQQMALREDQLFAEIDEREFAPIKDHGLEGRGGYCAHVI